MHGKPRRPAEIGLRRGFEELGTMNDSTKSLHNKVAVVTGGGRGIGYAISARLAEMGATTVICGRSQPTH